MVNIQEIADRFHDCGFRIVRGSLSAANRYWECQIWYPYNEGFAYTGTGNTIYEAVDNAVEELLKSNKV